MLPDGIPSPQDVCRAWRCRIPLWTEQCCLCHNTDSFPSVSFGVPQAETVYLEVASMFPGSWKDFSLTPHICEHTSRVLSGFDPARAAEQASSNVRAVEQPMSYNR
jgi:hypothetical protein